MIYRLFSQQKRLFIQILAWMILGAVVELGSAMIFGLLIDQIHDLNHFRFYGICGGFILVHFISQFGKERAIEQAKRQTRITLINGAVQAYLSQSNTAFHQLDLNTYINKLSTEMDTLMDQYMTPLLRAIGLAVNFVFGCVYFFTLSPLILFFLLAGSMIMVGFNILFRSKLKTSQKEVLSQKKKWLSSIQELYTNFSVIKNYDLETMEYDTLRKTNQCCANAIYENSLLLAKLDAFNFEIGYVLFFGQVFLCGFLLHNGAAAGLAVSAMQVSNTITNPVINFSTLRNRLVSNGPILESFLSLCDQTIPHTKNSVHEKIERISVKIDQFALHEKTILHDIEISFFRNEKIMIIGPSGCGKTTLFNILKGEIAMDPQLPDFHDQCSIIEQDAPLFPWSIKENICLNAPYNKIRLDKILNMVGLSHLDIDHILRFDHDTLSGGERQRIQLARALYHARPWILMDEAFSALDSETTKKIEQIFLDQDEQAMISICHKPVAENISRYDTVLYMDHGTITKILHPKKKKTPI